MGSGYSFHVVHKRAGITVSDIPRVAYELHKLLCTKNSLHYFLTSSRAQGFATIRAMSNAIWPLDVGPKHGRIFRCPRPRPTCADHVPNPALNFGTEVLNHVSFLVYSSNISSATHRIIPCQDSPQDLLAHSIHHQSRTLPGIQGDILCSQNHPQAPFHRKHEGSACRRLDESCGNGIKGPGE